MRHTANFLKPGKSEHTRIYDSNKGTYDSDDNDTLLDLERKIKLARGQGTVKLAIKNAKIINVLSGSIPETDVAIAIGIFVGSGGEGGYDTKEEYDAQGRIICPGFIDGHVHIESTFLSPTESCKVVALHCTSAVVCDPTKIANVLGLSGIDYFLRSSNGLPAKIYIIMTS